MFKLECPKCHHSFGTASSLAGKTTECPACHETVSVPDDSKPSVTGGIIALSAAALCLLGGGGVGIWGIIQALQGHVPMLLVPLFSIGGFIGGGIAGAAVGVVIAVLVKAVRSVIK